MSAAKAIAIADVNKIRTVGTYAIRNMGFSLRYRRVVCGSLCLYLCEKWHSDKH